MINDKRKIELAVLAEIVTIAYDDYYVEQDQDDFDDLMEEISWIDTEANELVQAVDKALLNGYLRQRQLGFDKFKAEAIQKFQSIQDSEELHSLMDNYNFDNGVGLLTEIIKNPHCSLQTAQKIYWLCMPTDFYDETEDLTTITEDEMGYEVVQLMILIEQKAKNNEFKHNPSLDIHDFANEDYIRVQIEASKKHNIPPILRQGLA